MNVLIDVTNLRFVKAAETVQQLVLWAEILGLDDRYYVTGDENKHFSRFTLAELRELYGKRTGAELSSGYDYAATLRAVADLARGVEVDATPYDALLARYGKPYPQAQIPASAVGRAPATAANGDASTKPAREKAASSEPTRPKAGTSTGKVWDIADDLTQKLGRKATRPEVVSACEVEGINASTASTQYGKWAKVAG